MFTTIVAAVDGSPCADRALETAIALAKSGGGRLFICSAVDPVVLTEGMALGGIAEKVIDDARTTAEATIAAALERARQSGIEAGGDVLMGEPAYEIGEYAKRQHADGLVLGTHGRTGLKRLFMGSVAETVLRSAACPVVIVREGAGVGAPA